MSNEKNLNENVRNLDIHKQVLPDDYAEDLNKIYTAEEHDIFDPETNPVIPDDNIDVDNIYIGKKDVLNPDNYPDVIPDYIHKNNIKFDNKETIEKCVKYGLIGVGFVASTALAFFIGTKVSK